MKELTLKEKGARKLEEWKQYARELNDQLDLSVSDAREEFEKQKKKLKRWLDSVDDELEHAWDISKEKALDIKSSIEELRVQAALGRAEVEDRFRDEQKKLVRGLHDLRQKVEHLYDSSREEAHEFANEMKDRVEDFQTRFDLFRLQLRLGQTEARDEWNEKKKDLSHKLKEIRTRLDHAEKEAVDKWKDFSSEMSEAWSHFKKAFKD